MQTLYKRLSNEDEKTITLFLAAALFAACNSTTEETTLAYPDGKPIQTNIVKKHGKKQNKTGEKRYYPSGTLQYEKHFADDGTPTGVWQYYYPEGVLFASATFSKDAPNGSNWQFLTVEGKPLFTEQYDSLRVVELSEMGIPSTIVLYRGTQHTHYQYYSNGTLRSKGLLVDGRRQGHWVFYHPSGIVQAEADYVDGREHGTYTVYRESGLPYYRGAYDNGRRKGQWEFYDADGNLAQTKQF